ncbi:MAG: hypothetical protein OXC60_10035 [Litoreibacter sp.]|nr:hypothetical protein [Litoreibacter sp.]MCY4334997.1 hypothetical protein [Litoreibacter sp.]
MPLQELLEVDVEFVSAFGVPDALIYVGSIDFLKSTADRFSEDTKMRYFKTWLEDREQEISSGSTRPFTACSQFNDLTTGHLRWSALALTGDVVTCANEFLFSIVGLGSSPRGFPSVGALDYAYRYPTQYDRDLIHAMRQIGINPNMSGDQVLNGFAKVLQLQ